MSYYSDIYKKRINRFGENAASRLEIGRRANFERFLYSSPHYLKFIYEEGTENEREVECVFEPRKQNETKTVMDILCRVGEEFEVGKIVTINGYRYMFWWWDERQDSGYNRWVVIKLTTQITFLNENGDEWTTEGYIYSQEDNMLKNELKSRSRSATLYLENLKLEFIMIPTPDMIQNTHQAPTNDYDYISPLQIGAYAELEYAKARHHWRITGFDTISTPGIAYVSMDPTLNRDLTPAPQKQPEDDPNDFFWLGQDFEEEDNG